MEAQDKPTAIEDEAAILSQDQCVFVVDNVQFAAFITELKKPTASNGPLLENHRGNSDGCRTAAIAFRMGLCGIRSVMLFPFLGAGCY